MTSTQTPRPHSTASTSPRCSPPWTPCRAQPEIAQFQFRARNEWISGTHNRSHDPGLLRRRTGGHQPHHAVHLRRRPPGGPGRQQQRARPPVEFLLHAIAACLTVRPGQHRRGPRHHPAPGRRPPSRATSTCWASSGCPTRCATATGRSGSASTSRVTPSARGAGRRWSSSPAGGRPSTTCWSTAPTSSSTSQPRRRPDCVVLEKEIHHATHAVVVIGAGQAGLAVSHLLTAAVVDHVVLERGRTAERWRSQRWDSLRLLTPNWMSRLPGWSYRGTDPPVHAGGRGGRVSRPTTPSRSVRRSCTGAEVQSVRAARRRYLVASDAR